MLETRPLVGEDFERVERELHEWFVEAEREVLGELLESLDVDVPSVEIGERRLHRVLNSTESYTTAVGPVKVARTLYRSGRERAVAPMELRAGIVEGHWTPLAARQASCVVAQMTPSEGEALLRELGNMAPSKSSLDRLPKALSARWEVSREACQGTRSQMADTTRKMGAGSRVVVSPRRRWSEAQKRPIVAESYRSGDSVSGVARRHGVHSTVLFRWRRRYRKPADTGAGFVPVIVGTPERTSAAATGRMEIVLGGDVRVIVDATVHAPALARVLAVVQPR